MNPPPPESEPTPLRSRTITGSGLLESAGLIGAAATLAGFLAPLYWMFELASHFRVPLAVATSLVAIASIPSRRWPQSLMLTLCALVNISTVAWIARPTGHLTSPSPLDARIRLLSINVHTANLRADLVMGEIQRTDPDVVLLMEVNHRWMEALAPLRRQYSNVICEARSDNFGIALLSRVPLRNAVVADLEGAEVPSIAAEVLHGGSLLQLLGTHPVPPATSEGARERNLQLKSIAAWAASKPGSVVVLGDLNVTPWSPYFGKLLGGGRLIRAHPGWGIPATWQVQHPLLRLPLDHCLVSSPVAVTRLEVGQDVGSDHRPLCIDLAIPMVSMVPEKARRHAIATPSCP